MNSRALQVLLTSGEYDEFEDVVLTEGEFIEADEQHVYTRQVILGVTSQSVVVANRLVANYKLQPEVYYQTEVDLDLDGLELSSVWPLCVVRVAISNPLYELKINVQGKIRYYKLANTRMNGNLEATWTRWQERVQYLREDPYGYIRAMCSRHNLPPPRYKKRPQEGAHVLPLSKDVVFESDKPSFRKKRRKRTRIS